MRPGEVVELAALAGLELAAAVTLLELESGGGHNVWGHDGVDTGGIYVKGAEVTKDVYLKYKARRHELGLQGVGPTQLTSAGFQDKADDAGGCWDWRVNCSVGFGILAAHVSGHGLHDGFRRYNGSGDAAERYADKADAGVKRWRGLLAGTSSTPSTMEDDTMVSAPPGTNDHIDIIVRGRTKLYLACSYNQTVDVHHIDFWGDTPQLGGEGQGVGGARKAFRLDANRPGPIAIPPNASMATIRYTAQHSFGIGVV
ncbi:hypothetical protein EV186_108153 [Labedaea rhizosphaerae]|uniref:Uncharacterized protein n=1 Tax=Labedaea rhizosphaerae TaxID=598644 RepID=A0A4R6RXW8_LABRH|nr:hypothetical protein EV186_108153 [Labedaea rhizosphaerae]